MLCSNRESLFFSVGQFLAGIDFSKALKDLCPILGQSSPTKSWTPMINPGGKSWTSMMRRYLQATPKFPLHPTKLLRKLWTPMIEIEIVDTHFIWRNRGCPKSFLVNPGHLCNLPRNHGCPNLYLAAAGGRWKFATAVRRKYRTQASRPARGIHLLNTRTGKSFNPYPIIPKTHIFLLGSAVPIAM